MLCIIEESQACWQLGGESGTMASWMRVSHAGNIEVIKASCASCRRVKHAGSIEVIKACCAVHHGGESSMLAAYR
jgi:hypothetical protein